MALTTVNVYRLLASGLFLVPKALKLLRDEVEVQLGGALEGRVPLRIVRLATNAALDACTYSAAGQTLTKNSAGALTVDSVLAVVGDRVLVQDQVTDTHNGWYDVTVAGSGSVAWVLTRADDGNASADFQVGALTAVQEGTVNASLLFSLAAAGVLDTDAITFAAFTGTVLGTGTPAPVGTAAAGVLTTSAPFDHIHAHGNQLGGTLHADATAAAAGFMTAAQFTKLLQTQLGASTRIARGVVTANVANLAAFTVAGNDGLTYVEGERVLLAGQTTAAECGLYVVGVVGGGTAALTRVADMPAAAAYVNGQVIEVSEGTIWAGSTWKSMATGAKVIGTDDPLFYPREVRRTLTLIAGTLTTGGTAAAGVDGLACPIFNAAKVSVMLTLNTPNTVTNTTEYCCPVAGRTAGKAGTGSLVVRANVAAGTINVADVSTVDLVATNW